MNNIEYSQIAGNGCGIKVPLLGQSVYIPPSLMFSGGGVYKYKDRIMANYSSEGVITSSKFDNLLDIVSVGNKKAKKNKTMSKTKKNKNKK